MSDRPVAYGPAALCDHGLSPLTGTRYGLAVVYTRVWYAPWRKRLWRRCWYCDLREEV